MLRLQVLDNHCSLRSVLLLRGEELFRAQPGLDADPATNFLVLRQQNDFGVRIGNDQSLLR